MSLVSKILFVVSCVPLLLAWFCINTVYAVTDDRGGSGAATDRGGSGESTDTDRGGSGSATDIQTVTLQNPLVVNSLEDLIVAILNIFITLMIPIIVFFIILAGFKYVTAQGNSGQIEEATTTFTYAVIGGVLILAAVAIAEIIKNTVDSFSV